MGGARLTDVVCIHALGDRVHPKPHHSFRVRGAASHHRDGTAMDVLMEHVGWKSASVARRYVGVTASAAGAGAKRSHETAFIEAGAVPLSDRFAPLYTAFIRAS